MWLLADFTIGHLSHFILGLHLPHTKYNYGSHCFVKLNFSQIRLFYQIIEFGKNKAAQHGRCEKKSFPNSQKKLKNPCLPPRFRPIFIFWEMCEIFSFIASWRGVDPACWGEMWNRP